MEGIIIIKNVCVCVCMEGGRGEGCFTGFQKGLKPILKVERIFQYHSDWLGTIIIYSL